MKNLVRNDNIISRISIYNVQYMSTITKKSFLKTILTELISRIFVISDNQKTTYSESKQHFVLYLLDAPI